MHVSNHYYGHDFILAWASSQRRPRPIWGYVQHGWKPEAAFPTGFRAIPRAPMFVWSSMNEAATRRRFPGRPVHAIGAPFLYLHKMLEPSLDLAPERDLLVYPCHGLKSEPLAAEVHQSLIDQVLDMRPSSVTVNLHTYEFQDDHIRSLYSSLPNCTLETNWAPPPFSISHDPLIMVRQMIQILRHERVASNCLTTALFYSAHLRRHTRLLRHPARRPAPLEGRGQALHDRLEADDAGDLRALAAVELGEDQMKDPAGLRELLGGDEIVTRSLATLARLTHPRAAR